MIIPLLSLFISTSLKVAWLGLAGPSNWLANLPLLSFCMAFSLKMVLGRTGSGTARTDMTWKKYSLTHTWKKHGRTRARSRVLLAGLSRIFFEKPDKARCSTTKHVKLSKFRLRPCTTAPFSCTMASYSCTMARGLEQAAYLEFWSGPTHYKRAWCRLGRACPCPWARPEDTLPTSIFNLLFINV